MAAALWLGVFIGLIQLKSKLNRILFIQSTLVLLIWYYLYKGEERGLSILTVRLDLEKSKPATFLSIVGYIDRDLGFNLASIFPFFSLSFQWLLGESNKKMRSNLSLSSRYAFSFGWKLFHLLVELGEQRYSILFWIALNLFGLIIIQNSVTILRTSLFSCIQTYLILLVIKHAPSSLLLLSSILLQF